LRDTSKLVGPPSPVPGKRRRALALAVAVLGGLAVPAHAAPVLTVDSSPIAFSPPTFMVGGGSPETLRRIQNTGSDPLTITITLRGANPGDFTLGGCVNVTLQPGEFCDVQAGFRPTAPGARTAILAIKSNDPAQPMVTIDLSGNASPVAPRLDVNPASLDFGLQPFGTPSDPRRVMVRNMGGLPLTITSVTSNSPEFTIVHGCTTWPLGPPQFTDSWCAVDVRFSPAAGGPRAGLITLVSDDPRGPVTVALAGMGPAPAASFSPASINFGSVEIGRTGTLRQVIVDNTGTAPLTVTAGPVSGANTADFAVRTPLPCTAPAQGRCTIDVAFSPRASGERLAEVAFTATGTTAPFTVALRGFGELFTATLPPPPLPADDHRFVAVGLPTTCATTGQTLTIPVSVTRVGPVGATPATPPATAIAAAVAAGTLSGSATLEIMAFDTGAPATHAVSMNGTPFGIVNAATGGWSLRTVTLPIGLMTFPTQGVAGAAPTAVSNVVTISPDTSGGGHCFAVAWARLSFLAMSPVILVHGDSQSGAFWGRRGFVAGLNAAGIPNDSSINLAPPGGSALIATNATTLQTLVPPIVRSFGVNSVHVVAHSKGGLDTRAWLSASGAANAAGTPGFTPFRVLSLTTLGTPHRGSALADLVLGIEATSVGLFGFTVGSLASLGISSPSFPDLTTFSAAAFNPPLPPAADYRMLGGDADLNMSVTIDSAPVDEYLAARAENAALAGIFAGPTVVVGPVTSTGPQRADAAMTAVYRILRSTRAVVVVTTTGVIPVPIPGLPFPLLIVVTVRLPAPIPGPPAPNDMLVTFGSATGGPAPFVSPLAMFGRDHASIANGGIAAAVIPLLITTDVSRGDLR
jgi:hypothetical protein